MKKLLSLILFSIVCFAAKSQNDSTFTDSVYAVMYDSTDHQFPQKWERLFSSISTDSVKTGFFLDRAVNWISPAKHQGNEDYNNGIVATDDSCFFETILSLHQSFKMAQVDTGSHTLFDSTDLLEAKAKQYMDNGKIPLVAFYMKYDCIRDSAFIDSLLYLDASDTSIHDVAGRTASPFTTASVFAAAPAMREIPQGVCKFLLPSDLYLCNTGETLSKAEIKLGTLAQWQELTMNTDLSADLSNTEGDMTIDLRFTYSDGTVKTSHTPVKFYKTDPYNTLYNNGSYDLNLQATSAHSGANVHIAYGCGKSKLTKPFIIVEPFDPMDQFDFAHYMHKILVDPTSQTFLMIQEMEAQGYDLVYIDFKYNTDYLERNTAVVQDVINWVNTTKAANGSTEPNVVMGISMGGVLGRNALRLMELANTDHQTKLFISVDAPHRGAYIPLSLQYFLADLENMSNDRIHIKTIEHWQIVDKYIQYFELPKEVKFALDVVKSPAAKQLLILNKFDLNYSHSNFYNTYIANGPLQNCREVAITNGSIIDKKQQYSSLSEIPDGGLLGSMEQYTINLSPTLLAIAGYEAWMDIYFKFWGLSQNTFTFNGHQYYQIAYKGKISVHFAIPTLYLQYDFYPINTEITQYAPAFDNAPGGFVGLKDIGGLDIQKLASSSMGVNSPYIPTDKFCFVPTVSSLDINTNNLNYDVKGNTVISTYYDSQTPPNIIGYTFSPTTTSNPKPTFQSFSAATANLTNQSQISNLWNESHSLPTANSGFVLGVELLGFPRTLTQGLHTIDNNYFNFGYLSNWNLFNAMFTTGNLLYNDLTIQNSGILYINGNEHLANGLLGGAIATPFPQTNSSFEVSSAGANCNSTGKSIEVKTTGSIILGSTTDTRTGILRMTNGSTLTFKSGSSLSAFNNSKLIIQTGATLNIESNVSINLNDNNCIIEFEPGAILILSSGVDLTFTGNGFIRFIGDDGSHSNFTTTNTNSIIIAGTGTGATQTHKILEFASSPAGGQLSFSGFQSFLVSGGKVQSNCAVDFHTIPVTIHDVTYQGGSMNCENTFTANTCVIHSNIDCFDHDVDVSHCDITGTLTTTGSINTIDVSITNSTFNPASSDNVALHLINATAVLSADHFTDNYFGMIAENSNNVTCVACTFDASDPYVATSVGINFSGNSTSSLNLDATNIIDMTDAGVKVENGTLFARCGNIKNTHIISNTNASIVLNTDATLSLDPSLTSPFTSGPVGNMDLSGFNNCIKATNALDIYIDNSGSNLATYQHGGNPVHYESALTGNLTNSYASGLYVRGNYWYQGHLPEQHYDWDNFYYQTIRFDNTNVDGSGYLTTPPNITNSCAFYEGGGGSFGKTGNNYSSKIIDDADSIPFENGHSLKHAVKLIFDDDIDTTLSGINAQLNLHEQILKHNFGSLKNKARPVVELVYQRMQLTVGVGLKHGVIQPTQTSTQINRLIIMQDTLLGRTTVNDSTKRFTLLKDKALALRLANRRSDALTFLSRAHGYADSTNKRFIEKWQCFIEKEIMLHDSVITKKQFLALVKQCGVPDTTSRYGKRSVNNIQPKQEKIISTPVAVANNLEVKLYPNPAFDNLNIVINNISDESKINIQIIDIVGRVMQTQTTQINIGQENLTINIPISLSSGTYLVKLEGEKINETKRFVVMK